MGAFVGRLGAVVEAECVLAGVAAKWEKVELSAVRVLAVRANGFEVGTVHFAEGLFGPGEMVGGSMVRHDEVDREGLYETMWRPSRLHFAFAGCSAVISRVVKHELSKAARTFYNQSPLGWRGSAGDLGLPLPGPMLVPAKVLS